MSRHNRDTYKSLGNAGSYYGGGLFHRFDTNVDAVEPTSDPGRDSFLTDPTCGPR